MLKCVWLMLKTRFLLILCLQLRIFTCSLTLFFSTVRIGLLYMISGFGGSLLSALFNRAGISVGASGALFGLLGAMLSELLTNWTIYANKVINPIKDLKTFTFSHFCE